MLIVVAPTLTVAPDYQNNHQHNDTQHRDTLHNPTQHDIKNGSMQFWVECQLCHYAECHYDESRGANPTLFHALLTSTPLRKVPLRTAHSQYL